MEQTLIKNIMIGQKVSVNGKRGIVLNRGGDDVYIRYDDGMFEQVNISQVNPELVETRLKNTLCPFCKSLAIQIAKESDNFGAEKVYTCSKCLQRFSIQ